MAFSIGNDFQNIGNSMRLSLERHVAPRIRHWAGNGVMPTLKKVHVPDFREVQSNRLFLPIHGGGAQFDPKEVDDFLSGHKFAHFIHRTNDEYIRPEELLEILNGVDFHIGFTSRGSMPAASSPHSSYSKFAWTRDMANKAIAMIETDCIDEAKTVINQLAEFYSKPENRSTIIKYHESFRDYGIPAREAWEDQRFGPIPIKAKIGEDGNMHNTQQGWMHEQFDALGAFLFVSFKLANKLSDPNNQACYDPNFLNRMDAHLTASINSQNYHDSIFAAMLKTLNRVEAWDNIDVGAWEDHRQRMRASSVGIVTAAAQEARFYFNHNGWDKIHIADREGFKHELNNLIDRGWESLNKRIPRDGSFAVECDMFPSDAALVFLLYPYNPGLSYEQELAILKDTYENRLGLAGISRRDQDDYVARNYHINPHGSGIMANLYVHNFMPAEWTIFDPVLGAFSFKRFSDNLTRGFYDAESFEMGQFHLKRSISQITKEDTTFKKQFYIHPYWDPESLACIRASCMGSNFSLTSPLMEINVPRDILPEAYFRDDFARRETALYKGPKMTPNENSPLLWAEANFQLMIKEALEATILWEQLNSIHGQTLRRDGKRVYTHAR